MLAVRPEGLCLEYLHNSKVWCTGWGGARDRQVHGVQSNQIHELQVLWRDPVPETKVVKDLWPLTFLTTHNSGTVQCSSLCEGLVLTEGWGF